MPNRIRDHSMNRHFNRPLCPCKFCDTYCENKSALKRHMNRQHNDEKRKKEQSELKIVRDNKTSRQLWNYIKRVTKLRKSVFNLSHR